MTNKAAVAFGIQGTRYETSYDRNQLRLGAAVYVRFPNAQESAMAFSPQGFDGAIEYRVKEIATSEWYVDLVRQFELRSRFAEKVQEEVGEYISRPDVDAALATFVRMIRMDRFYITAELGENPLSVVFTIINRLADCRRLRQSPPFAAEMLRYLDDPLVSYLYLTCFDRLGQPAKWLDFGSWLESFECENERSRIFQEASKAGSIVGTFREVYRQYNSVYGVRLSSLRFLREILPPELRRELLDSIDRVIITNPPDSVARQATDDEKEKYLFRRRNDYTHKGDFRPPPGEWFGGGFVNRVQERFANYWTSTQTRGWPDVLEKAVRVGLARYLLACLGEK